MSTGEHTHHFNGHFAGEPG